MNRSVNLTKRIKTPNGLRFCTVARSANGRIKANFVSIDGREEQHPEGSYYIEWYDGSKRLRRSVGKNAFAAKAKRHQHEQMFTAKADGLKAGLKRNQTAPRWLRQSPHTSPRSSSPRSPRPSRPTPPRSTTSLSPARHSMSLTWIAATCWSSRRSRSQETGSVGQMPAYQA